MLYMNYTLYMHILCIHVCVCLYELLISPKSCRVRQLAGVFQLQKGRKMTSVLICHQAGEIPSYRRKLSFLLHASFQPNVWNPLSLV